MHFIVVAVIEMPVVGGVVDVEQGFMPWLMERVEDELTKTVRGRVVVDGMVREVVRARAEAYRKLEEKQQYELLAKEAAKALAAKTATPAKTASEVSSA